MQIGNIYGGRKPRRSARQEIPRFEQAGRYELRSGKFAGRTIAQIAETDEGLSYLVFMAKLSTGANDLVQLNCRVYTNHVSVAPRAKAARAASEAERQAKREAS